MQARLAKTQAEVTQCEVNDVILRTSNPNNLPLSCSSSPQFPPKSDSPSSSSSSSVDCINSLNDESPVRDIQNSDSPTFDQKLFPHQNTHQVLDNQSRIVNEPSILSHSSPPMHPPQSFNQHKTINSSFSHCFRFSSSSSSQNNAKSSKDVRKRSSKACDNCRKSKCKCTRAADANGLISSNTPCQSCLTNSLECTFNGTSRKRGPPKGYIEAIESRLHRMEAFLGGLLGNTDPRAQALLSELLGDNDFQELLQTDLKTSTPSARNVKSGKIANLFDFSMRNFTSRAKPQLTNPQMSPCTVNPDLFAESKNPRHEDPNKLGAHFSDPDDDSKGGTGSPNRSPLSIHALRYDHHRTRRRRLGSHPPSDFTRRSELPPLNTSALHYAGVTSTLTQSELLTPSHHSSHLITHDPPQIAESNALPSRQHSADPMNELVDVVGQLSLDENNEVRYHGRSSGLYMISASHRYKNFFWQFPKPGFWPVAPICRSRSTLDIFELVNPLEVLPDRETMNHLLDFYWAFVHSVMPVLYKEEFLCQFQNLMNNVDKVSQARPHWTANQVWSHSLSGTSSSRDASLDESSYNYSPPIFISDTEPCVMGLEPTNKMSILLLLVIFAISSRYSNRLSGPPIKGQYWNSGDKFFEKAKQLLNIDYGNSKLTNCQSLILMAYREIGSGAMGESWLYTGMAIRMAQDMGLFRDVDKWFMPVKRFTHEEKQTRKRVWWACVNIDKYVSTYIGRPMMIFERDYDTAFPSTDEPDEYEQWVGWSPDGRMIDLSQSAKQASVLAMTERVENDRELPEKKDDSTGLDQQSLPDDSFTASAQERSHTISCFSQSASLSVLISRIVANMYAIRIRVVGQSSETLLSLLDQNLARWYLDLPEQLRYKPQPISQTPVKSSFTGFGSPQRTLTPHLLTLHAQFYTALILLHRPFIPQSPPPVNQGNLPLDTPSCSPSHSICTTAANAITSIAQAYSRTFGLRQAPVFLVYYIFTAAILHVYNASSDAGLALTAKANLVICMDSLKEMAPTWTGAVRAWELLVGLVDLREHHQLDDLQCQVLSSHVTASNLNSHNCRKLNLNEDRGLKRPASTRDPEDQTKHSFAVMTNPQTSSHNRSSVPTPSFHASFDHSRLNFDRTTNQEVAQSQASATFESVKLTASFSDSDRSATVDANAAEQMNTASPHALVCEQDTHLLQSTRPDSRIGVSNEARLSLCGEKDLDEVILHNTKYRVTANIARVLSSNMEPENPIGLNYTPNCEFLRDETNVQNSNRPAGVPSTALEGMMGLMNSSRHSCDYHHQPFLQTLVPATQSRLEQLEEQQLFHSDINRGLSPLPFAFNNLTPNLTIGHHPYGVPNDPEFSAAANSEIFGRPAPPQLANSTEEGVVKLQQQRMAFSNLNGGIEKVEPERERHHLQERMRTGSSLVLKDEVPSDEAFADFDISWSPSPADSVGGYGDNPSCRIYVDPQSYASPSFAGPHHPTHHFPNYHSYSMRRTHH